MRVRACMCACVHVSVGGSGVVHMHMVGKKRWSWWPNPRWCGWSECEAPGVLLLCMALLLTLLLLLRPLGSAVSQPRGWTRAQRPL